MKIWELASGLLTPLTEEEDDLLQKLIDNDDVDLTEREQLIAQRMTSRDILIREDDECKFSVNYRVDVWRD